MSIIVSLQRFLLKYPQSPLSSNKIHDCLTIADQCTSSGPAKQQQQPVADGVTSADIVGLTAATTATPGQQVRDMDSMMLITRERVCQEGAERMEVLGIFN